MSAITVFVDTGYFLALAGVGDELNPRAQLWAAAMTRKLSAKLVTTEYVLVEAVNRLSDPLDRPKAIEIIQFVRFDSRCDFIPASETLFNGGMQLYQQRMDKRWSLTDCVSFHVMAERKIPSVLSFDHHFQQAGFEALLRRDP